MTKAMAEAEDRKGSPEDSIGRFLQVGVLSLVGLCFFLLGFIESDGLYSGC